VTAKITVFLRDLVGMFIYIRLYVIFSTTSLQYILLLYGTAVSVVHFLPEDANKVKVKLVPVTGFLMRKLKFGCLLNSIEFRGRKLHSVGNHLVAFCWRSFYAHNGTYSDVLFHSLWMDQENQKHGLALQSMGNSQVPYDSVHYRSHFILFCTV